MERICLALDLKDDPALIARYEEWHRPERIWPEVVASLRAGGIENLEIFRCGNRLVMVVDAPAGFDVTQLAKTDNARSKAWEDLMWRFQQSLPFAKPGEKWVPMHRLFSLTRTLPARGSIANG